MSEHALLFVSVTAVLAVLLITIELLFPARTYADTTKKKSYFTNTLIFVCNNTITFLLQISAIFSIILIYSPTSTYFELLPTWVQIVAGILILDFSIWFWHRLNHKIPLLWSFHKCHHSEKYLNVTSALRFHIGEILLSVVWKSAVLIMLGIPLWIFLISEFLLTAFAMFHHANIEFSPKARRVLETCIISPYLHRVHHSDIRNEHDSNYGVIFSWWDTLFSTIKRVTPAEIGLKGTGEKNFLSFLLFPFRKR